MPFFLKFMGKNGSGGIHAAAKQGFGGYYGSGTEKRIT